MPEVSINYFAILIATIASMIVGAIWYSKSLFGKMWMDSMGKTEADLKGAGTGYVVTIVASLVTGYVMSHIIDYAQADTISEGLKTGFWVWLGFVLTTQTVQAIWSSGVKTFFYVNMAHELVNFLLFGAILARFT